MAQLPFPESLFTSKEYIDSYARSLHGCKKAFDSFLDNDLCEKLKNGAFDRLEQQPEVLESIDLQEGTKIHTRGKRFDVPVELFSSHPLTLGLTLQNIINDLSNEERERVFKLLPGQSQATKESTIDKLTSNEKIGHIKPLENFL